MEVDEQSKSIMYPPLCEMVDTCNTTLDGCEEIRCLIKRLRHCLVAKWKMRG